MRIKWHNNAKCSTLCSLNLSYYLLSHTEVKGVGDIGIFGAIPLGQSDELGCH